MSIGDACLHLVRKSGGFVGGLGEQITLTLEDKCEAKVNYDLAKIEFDLLMMRAPSAVFTPCCIQPSSKVHCRLRILRQIISRMNLLEKIFW